MSYKLGKKPAKFDKRTIKLSAILNIPSLPDIPVSYDIDTGLGANVPEQLFGNDQKGDCVIAGRANTELRFQWFQQEKIIPITTDDCLNEYYKEEGWAPVTTTCFFGLFKHQSPSPPDNGLVMLDSLKEWQQKGWTLGGETYTIYAFASVDWKNHLQIQQAVYLLNGVLLGVNLPQSAEDQFHANQSWTVVPNSPIIGGHCIYIVGYNNVGPVIITWGRKVQTTWEWCDLYIDEAYALVDQKDSWVQNDSINIELLQSYLDAITNQNT